MYRRLEPGTFPCGRTLAKKEPDKRLVHLSGFVSDG
jgi:hypothetical protein